MLKTMLWGALIVATSLLNTHKGLSKLNKNWLSYEQNTICPYLDIRTKYYRFWLNNYLTVDFVVKLSQKLPEFPIFRLKL